MIALPQDPAVEAALRASIKRFGVLVPVIVNNKTGEVLDGHTRIRICEEEGIEYGKYLTPVPEDADVAEIVASINDDRRQKLTTEQREEMVNDLGLKGHSQRAIAGALGVGRNTVRRDLSKPGGIAIPPEKVTGQDGKKYPATNGAKKKKPSRLRITEGQEPTARQVEFSTAAKKRLDELAGTCAAIAGAPEHIKITMALQTATSDEVKFWVKNINEAIVGLKKLATILKEEQ